VLSFRWDWCVPRFASLFGMVPPILAS
jgi:hypothetical protein